MRRFTLLLFLLAPLALAAQTSAPTKTTSTHMLTGLSPNLGVADVRRSLQFYTDKLGFSQLDSVEIEGNLIWAMCIRDGVTMMLGHMDTLADDMPETKGQKPALTGVLFITVADVNALLKELQAKGVAIAIALNDKPYGTEFALRDPDGYLLTFCQLK